MICKLWNTAGNSRVKSGDLETLSDEIFEFIQRAFFSGWNSGNFFRFWGDFLTKLPNKTGEKGKNPLEKSKSESSGDGAPKLQTSVPSCGRTRPGPMCMSPPTLAESHSHTQPRPVPLATRALPTSFGKIKLIRKDLCRNPREFFRTNSRVNFLGDVYPHCKDLP